ncbi:MAG: caspase domain-containing protein [Xanthobacteraceae bacterium]
MFKFRSRVLGAVKYAIPVVALLPVAFGISFAVGKLAPEQAKPALGKVPVLQSAVSTSRVALIIGNANYPDATAPLAHPVRDAQALAQQLRRSGFTVDLQTNLGKDEMKRVVEAFKAKIKPGSVALISYGGLGIQAGRESYMIPVDARIWREADVRRDGISIESLLADMDGRGASVKLAILDASRRNPFERRFRGLSAGLAPIDAPLGTLLVSAAAPGKVVVDGDGAHSLLIGELLKEINAPGVGAETVFRQTRVGVSRASNGEQIPLVSSSLTESFAFVGTAPREIKAIDGTEMLRPATARAETSDTTIVWAADTSDPAEKTDISPTATESKPENTVTTSASQYEIASRPVETPVQYEMAPRPIETPVQAAKEAKPRKSVEETKLPRRPTDEISRESAREQPRVNARRDGSYAASPSERDWRVASAFPRRQAPMLFLGVGY